MFFDPLAPRTAECPEGCTPEETPPVTPPTQPPTTPEEMPPTQPESPQIPSDAIDPKLLALAMAFVPYQSWETPYANDVAFTRGTIFPSLDKPLLMERPIPPDRPVPLPATKKGGM